MTKSAATENYISFFFSALPKYTEQDRLAYMPCRYIYYFWHQLLIQVKLVICTDRHTFLYTPSSTQTTTTAYYTVHIAHRNKQIHRPIASVNSQNSLCASVSLTYFTRNKWDENNRRCPSMALWMM